MHRIWSVPSSEPHRPLAHHIQVVDGDGDGDGDGNGDDNGEESDDDD